VYHKTVMQPLATASNLDGQARQIDDMIDEALTALGEGSRLESVAVNLVAIPGEPTRISVTVLAER
jgi:hypothetical protein